VAIDEDLLSDVLSEFARTLVTDFSIERILDHLVDRIVDLLPIDAAGVSLISPVSHPQLIAGSDESAFRYERLQGALGEGPCVAAYRSGGPIAIADLAREHRFPRFAEKARAEGLAAVFTFPLRSGDRRLGALDLYRTSPGALDAREMATAETLADVTTAYLLNAQSRQARTEFVATVAHELRTPTTSIAGFVELLRDEQAGDLTAAQSHFVDAIARNGDRLTALADDLLALSRLESGAFAHEPVIVDLGQVVLSARSALELLMGARRLEIEFEIPAEPLLVRGDAEGLQSVVSNLMSNALKFTGDGGLVRCVLLRVDDHATLVVSDNGLGIPEDEQPDLFRRFFRSSTAYEHGIQGSGLGLTIVETIVHAHGGDITVKSRHLEGSAFTVTLPLVDEGLDDLAS
jgi:signal transduction histidine kinase